MNNLIQKLSEFWFVIPLFILIGILAVSTFIYSLVKPLIDKAYVNKLDKGDMCAFQTKDGLFHIGIILEIKRDKFIVEDLNNNVFLVDKSQVNVEKTKPLND